MSNKLKFLFLVSIPIFIVHGVEEYVTGFYNVDSHANFLFGYFYTLPTPQATFLLFQVMLWLALVISALLISGEKWRLRLMVVPGLIYIYELHHFWKAIEIGGYYPGVLTALAFPIVGLFYWGELLKNLKLKEV